MPSGLASFLSSSLGHAVDVTPCSTDNGAPSIAAHDHAMWSSFFSPAPVRHAHVCKHARLLGEDVAVRHMPSRAYLARDWFVTAFPAREDGASSDDASAKEDAASSEASAKESDTNSAQAEEADDAAGDAEAASTPAFEDSIYFKRKAAEALALVKHARKLSIVCGLVTTAALVLTSVQMYIDVRTMKRDIAASEEELAQVDPAWHDEEILANIPAVREL
eukprot:gnl/TRDRNA2_/TRDRNA2_194410_c0_seq1.p1 gnl/TRDRNA2_/TRDRNA2_194410_c0~~gnl/TRDRNA2_/TRDRNA2_194410_c0_seq1.p1  ORF type:complete len:220 (-),score=43.49 gnl/TRDRNA2_/TRDRNA2_194410_c0_seq1:70-729(-)